MKNSRLNLLTYLGLFLFIADCQVKGITVGGILNTISNIIWPSSTVMPTTLLTTSIPTTISITDVLSLDTKSNSVTDRPKVTLFTLGTGSKSSSFTDQLVTLIFTSSGSTKTSSTDVTLQTASTSSTSNAKSPNLFSSARNTPTSSFMETSSQPSSSSRGVTSNILFPGNTALSSFTPSNDNNILTITSSSVQSGSLSTSTNSVLKSSKSSINSELTRNTATTSNDGISIPSKSVITSSVGSTVHSSSTSSTVASLITDPNMQIELSSATASIFSSLQPESDADTIPSSITVTNTEPKLSSNPTISFSLGTSIQSRPLSPIPSSNTGISTEPGKIRNPVSSHNAETHFQTEISNSAWIFPSLGTNVQSEINRGDISFFTTGTEPSRGDLSSSKAIPNMPYELTRGTWTSNRISIYPITSTSTASPFSIFTSVQPETSKNNVTSSTSLSRILPEMTITTFISSSADANIQPKLTSGSETSKTPDLSSEMYFDTGTNRMPVTSSKIRTSIKPTSFNRVRTSSTSKISTSLRLTLGTLISNNPTISSRKETSNQPVISNSPINTARIQFGSNSTVTSFKPNLSSTSVISSSAGISKKHQSINSTMPYYRLGTISKTTISSSTGINVKSKLSKTSVPYSTAVTRIHSEANSHLTTSFSVPEIASTKLMDSSLTGIGTHDQLTHNTASFSTNGISIQTQSFMGTLTSGRIQPNTPISKFASPITWESQQSESSSKVPFSFSKTTTNFKQSSGIHIQPETSSGITPPYSIWKNIYPDATQISIASSNTEPRFQSELPTSRVISSSAIISMQSKPELPEITKSSFNTESIIKSELTKSTISPSFKPKPTDGTLASRSVLPESYNNKELYVNTVTSIKPELSSISVTPFGTGTNIHPESNKLGIALSTQNSIHSSRSLITTHPKLNSNTLSIPSNGITSQLVSASGALTPSSFQTNIASEVARSGMTTSSIGHHIQSEPESNTMTLSSARVINQPESMNTVLSSTESSSKKITSLPAKSAITTQQHGTGISTHKGSSSSLLSTSNTNSALEFFSTVVSKQSKTDSTANISVPATNDQRTSTTNATTFLSNRTHFQATSLSSTVTSSGSGASNLPNSHSNGVTSHIGLSFQGNFYSTRNYSATVDRGINGQTAAAPEMSNFLLAWQIILICLAVGLATFALVGGTFLIIYCRKMQRGRDYYDVAGAFI